MTENIGHAKGTTGRVVTSFRITIFTANTCEFGKNGFDTFRVTFRSHVWNKEKDFYFHRVLFIVLIYYKISMNLVSR